MKKIIAAAAAACLLLTGCNMLKPVENEITGTAPSDSTAPSVSTDFAQNDAEMFTDRDSRPEYSEAESIVITLNGDTASCDSAFVTVEGSKVLITGGGTYILRGTLNDGMVLVQSKDTDKPQLVLDGAHITSSTSAALYIKEADKVFVTLVGENSLTNGGSFTAIDDSNIDGAVFSKQDLTFNGAGSLTVSSPAGHGIVCKDDLVFTGGTYTIQSASHGLDANDSVRFRGAEMSIDTGKDGIHSENSEDAALGFVYISGGKLKIEAEGDGIDAGSFLQMESGTVEILAGGGYENGESHSSGGWGDMMGGGGRPGGMRPGGRSVEEAAATDEASTSMKGLKSGTELLVNGGTVIVDSADDGLHANTSAVINGGTLQIASGDDGVHAEETLTITDGTINITQSYEGLEALNIHITGGSIKLVATDDGLNAAGGTDSSGTGGRDQMFGPGGMGGSSNGSIIIEGGELNVQASGDGIDANGYLEIKGGNTTVCGPNSGDTATLDYDSYASITGGTFIGTGASGMAQTFSANEQGVLAVSVGMGQSTGVKITVSDSGGKELMSYTPELPFSVIIFSSPELVSGETYHVTVGTLEGDLEAS